MTGGGSEVEWVRAEAFGGARHSVRAELRALTIRTSHSARGAQRTARPTFFRDWRCKCVPLRSAHGFACPQKAASRHSAVGGGGKLVLYHHQLRAAGQNQLCRAETGDVVLAAMKFNHERFVWHCGLCLLMPDHLHAIIAFPREPECKRLSGIGRSSSRENMAWIGSAIFSITACATVANWRRRLKRFHKRC